MGKYNYDKEILMQGILEYRKGYEKDIEKHGEDYWKEKILENYGAYESHCVMWSDYHSDVIADALDNNCPSILILANIVLNEMK